MRQWSAGIVMVAALLAFCSRACAEDNTWASDEAKVNDLQITLKSGEIIRGRFSADTDDKVMIAVTGEKGKSTQTIKKEDVASHEWVPRLE